MSFCRLRGRRRLGVDQEIKISKTERSSHQPNSKSWSGGNTRAESAAPPGVSDFLCLSHTLNQEAEYGDQERDFG
jgi:hypothetical protein